MRYHVSPNNGGLLHGRRNLEVHPHCSAVRVKSVADVDGVIHDLYIVGMGHERSDLGAHGNGCVLCVGGVHPESF